MLPYVLRRLLFVVPTLFGIMVLNFFIVQTAPGGPVEQMIAQIQGTAVGATERFSGSSSGGEMIQRPQYEAGGPIAERAVCPRRSSSASSACTASTSRSTSASGS